MELNKVNTPYYNDYGTWIRGQFPFRVQKISIDAGFTCPNRLKSPDGSDSDEIERIYHRGRYESF